MIGSRKGKLAGQLRGRQPIAVAARLAVLAVCPFIAKDRAGIGVWVYAVWLGRDTRRTGRVNKAPMYDIRMFCEVRFLGGFFGR